MPSSPLSPLTPREVEVPPAPSRRAPDEVDLASLLGALWARRLWVGLAVVVGAALGVAWSMSRPLEYEASATLAVVPSQAGDITNETTLPVSGFRPFVANHTIAAGVIAKFGLERGDGQPVSPAEFLRTSLTVNEIPQSNLLVLSFRAEDGQKAADVLTKVVEDAIASSRQSTQDGLVRARDDIKHQLDQVEQRWRDASAALATYRTTAQIEMLRKDVETALTQRADLQKARAELALERGRLARLEVERKSRPRVDSLTRSLDLDPSLSEGLRAQGTPAGALLGMTATNQSVSAVFEGIDRDLAGTHTKVDGLEQLIRELVTRAGVGGNALKQLNELYAREAKLTALEVEHEIARKLYDQVATQYEMARLRVVSRTPQLQVVDPPVVPMRPQSRATQVNAILGALVGLLVASASVVGRQVTRLA